jgi:hypothetical protein
MIVSPIADIIFFMGFTVLVSYQCQSQNKVDESFSRLLLDQSKQYDYLTSDSNTTNKKGTGIKSMSINRKDLDTSLVVHQGGSNASAAMFSAPNLLLIQ